jgi:hypothetical protein
LTGQVKMNLEKSHVFSAARLACHLWQAVANMPVLKTRL